MTMDPMYELIQDVFMLALTTWREARGEVRQGKIAVAHSIMNRVRNPAWWGGSVLAVAAKKWQYSSLTAPGDAQLVIWPLPDDRSWQECLEIALGVYDLTIPNPAPGADSYFSDTIPPPAWADIRKFVVKIGHHSFFNLGADHEKVTP